MVLQKANEYNVYVYAIFAHQEGYTALMQASVRSSDTQIMKALLAAGANTEATDKKVNQSMLRYQSMLRE